MMDELELLKKDWQKKEDHLPKLTYDQIYKMIWKKSSSIVKWIFYISVIELIFWAMLNVFSYNQDSMALEKEWHVYEISTALNVVYYIILICFIYVFYKNYKQISVTDSSRKLMKSILKVKRTVTWYVWFNIAIFAVSFLMYGSLRYGEQSQLIIDAAEKAGNETIFWLMLIGICLIAVTVILALVWLFYKLLYGILLGRLKTNYRELKRLEF